MLKKRLASIVVLALLTTSTNLGGTAAPAHASGICDFLSGMMRKICLQKQTGSHAPPMQTPAPTPRSGPRGQAADPSQRQNPAYVPGNMLRLSAPSGAQRFDVVSGGLFIDIPGNGYPAGYGPAWAVTVKPQTIYAMRELVGRAADRKSMSFSFASEDGHPVFKFSIQGFQGCTADLAGLPQAITTATKRFWLINVHGADRYCNSSSYAGWISLSTDSAGDILAVVDLTTTLGRGANQMHFVATDLHFDNIRNPQWAQAQAAQKAQQVAANAKFRQQDEAKLGHKLNTLELTLSPDWEAGLSKEEFKEVSDNPQDYAQLCMQHNPRACFAVKETVNLLRMDDVLANYPHDWSQPHAQVTLSALRQVCATQRTIKDHASYCDASDTLNYAMVENFGPKEQDLRRCLAISPTSYATQKVYVDRTGGQSYGEVDHQITGNDLKNICAFTVVYSTGSADGPQVLPPGRAVHLDIGILGSMFNMNTLHFRWIKRR